METATQASEADTAADTDARTSPRRPRLGELATSSERVSADALASALAKQADAPDRYLGELLIEAGALSEHALADLLRQQGVHIGRCPATDRRYNVHGYADGLTVASPDGDAVLEFGEHSPVGVAGDLGLDYLEPSDASAREAGLERDQRFFDRIAGERVNAPRPLFGQIAVERGFVGAAQLGSAMLAQADRGRHLGAILVGMGAMTKDQVREVIDAQGVRIARDPTTQRSYNVHVPVGDDDVPICSPFSDSLLEWLNGDAVDVCDVDGDLGLEARHAVSTRMQRAADRDREAAAEAPSVVRATLPTRSGAPTATALATPSTTPTTAPSTQPAVTGAAAGTGLYGMAVKGKTIVFVLDISHSMSLPAQSASRAADQTKTRHDVALQQLRQALHQMLVRKQAASFTLIAFHNEVFTWCNRAVPLRADMFERAMGWLGRTKPIGGTATHDALVAALGIPNVDTVYVISDGMPQHGTVIRPDEIRAAVRAVNEGRGVVINSIGVEVSPEGEAFLRALAADNAGRYVAVRPTTPAQ